MECEFGQAIIWLLQTLHYEAWSCKVDNLRANLSANLEFDLCWEMLGL